MVERANAALLRRLGPFLKPTVCRVVGLDTGLMAEKPEQNIVCIALAEHHGFEVEFDKGLARKARIVAKNPQLHAVGNESPKMSGRTVQGLLKKAMRAAAERA